MTELLFRGAKKTGQSKKQAGFRLVLEEQHHSFGKDLSAWTWELDLRVTP